MISFSLLPPGICKVERILRAARSNGRVGIVTLAQRPWVLLSVHEGA